jgi:hypothetical protein
MVYNASPQQQAELRELLAGVEGRDNGGTINPAAHTPDNDSYNAGFVAGVNKTFALMDTYNTPATNAAMDTTFIMGMICALPLSGFGELPREAVKVLAGLLNWYISNTEAENAAMQHGFAEALGMQLPDNFYSIDHAQELRRSIIDYYSGKGGGRFASYLEEMPVARWLLGLRSQYADTKVEPHMALLDRMIADETEGTYHERGIKKLRELETALSSGSLDDPNMVKVFQTLKGMAQSQSFNTSLKVRQDRHRKRISKI